MTSNVLTSFVVNQRRNQQNKSEKLPESFSATGAEEQGSYISHFPKAWISLHVCLLFTKTLKQKHARKNLFYQWKLEKVTYARDK